MVMVKDFLRWLYSSTDRPSAQNGAIKARRVFGRWHVTVGGYDETSPVMERLWRKAVRQIPSGTKISQVLVLGFGAGGSVENLHRRFPSCRITAIEHDAEMVRLARELELYRKNHAPRVLFGDAKEVLAKLPREERFDLILFDLYTGRRTSPLLGDGEFLRLIRTHLAPRGYFIVNAFLEENLLATVDRYFARHKEWTFRFNRVALYRPFGAGRAGDPLPEEFVNPRQIPSYLRALRNEDFKYEIIGRAPSMGLRWQAGPVYFEEYMSEEEPNILPFAKPRIVIWRAFTRLTPPKGWHASWFRMEEFRQTGFALVENREEYWLTWSEHAIRYRKKFLGKKDVSVRELPMEKFIAAYPANGKYGGMKKRVGEKLKNFSRENPSGTHFFAIVDAHDNPLAGLAVSDFPSVHQSLHLAAFHAPYAKDQSLGVGLIDHWFHRSIAQNIAILDLGVFWTPGDPRGWKGFSRFKGQFGAYYIRYPKPFLKFVRGV